MTNGIKNRSLCYNLSRLASSPISGGKGPDKLFLYRYRFKESKYNIGSKFPIQFLKFRKFTNLNRDRTSHTTTIHVPKKIVRLRIKEFK